ncbi:MAG: ywkE [Chlamydiales bacterium]|jgi:release factor glutamine methyltransferase|nr:ywkE [Chlamydiales bacterium]
MKTVQEILNLSTKYLEEKGIPLARRQAEELLSHHLGLNRLDLYLKFDYPLQEVELTAIRESLRRRSNREPVQYIQGQVEFYDTLIEVNPNVLIPRQETEILVSLIVARLKKESDLSHRKLWDLCCGSGCIAISLKKAFPELQVIASDVSLEAITVSKRNAYNNRVDVEFIEGDFLQPLKGNVVDYLVCNPPYIAQEEYHSLEPEVRNYEPKLALIGGDTGLEFYQKMSVNLHNHIVSGGNVWLEIGANQGVAISKMFKETGFWKTVDLIQDWAGLDRFFFLEKH